MSRAKKRIVVLISGSGSNLQAIIDDCQSPSSLGEVVAVVSNRPDVAGLDRARRANIAARTLDHTTFESREKFDQALLTLIDEYQPDLVVLAGFMRILTEGFVDHYLGRLINIHPSLLPKYPGLNTHQRAIDDGEAFGGATVHYVTGELDGGPAIVQARVAIAANATAETLAAEVLKREHLIYPLAVQWICEERLSYDFDNGATLLDGELLPEHGVIYEETSSSQQAPITG